MSELTEQALHGVIENYVLREGTDYGEQEFALNEKVTQVLQQLQRGDAQIMFDPSTESVGIVVKGG